MTDPPQPPSSHWTVLSCGLNLLNSLYDVGLSRNSGDMRRPKLFILMRKNDMINHELLGVGVPYCRQNECAWLFFQQVPTERLTGSLSMIGFNVFTACYLKTNQPDPLGCACAHLASCKILQLLRWVHLSTSLYDMCVRNKDSESFIPRAGLKIVDTSNWHFLARKIMILSKRFIWWFHIFRRPLRYLTFSSHSIRHGHVIFRSGAYLVPKNIYQAGWPKVRHCRLHPPRLATFRWF